MPEKISLVAKMRSFREISANFPVAALAKPLQLRHAYCTDRAGIDTDSA